MTDRPDTEQKREYEQSGLYPKQGKSFRILGLLGVLLLVILFMAGAAAIVDWLVDY
ncbi:MAG: hypothetical protein WEB57_02810 [Pseudohongiellaceae bacterium]